jgi:tetratricopeptide (TPR) repeat protein
VTATETATLSIELPRHTRTLLAATESGIDIRLESTGAPAADSPIRRSGTQHLILDIANDPQADLRMIPKDHPRSGGTVRVRAFDLGSIAVSNRCRTLVDQVVAGDQAYAMGAATVHGAAQRESASQSFNRAWQAYSNAFALSGDGLLPLSKAELAHSLAALQYQDRQDWADAKNWADRAADLYGAAKNSYGRARAQALQAASLMEIATLPESESAGDAVRRESADQLSSARRLLAYVAAFHSQRGERYDEAIQRNNIGLAYYYSGDYTRAERGYRDALPLYETLGETDRQAQVLQNIALLDWERGRFPASIAGYEHALQVLDRAASPKLYAEILNNVAMANFSLGQMDLAWRHHSDALDILKTLQVPREQARSLYGIAAIYAAIGDLALAKDFLQQSLAIRSAALDTRGRVGSLRALAEIEAQDGHPQEALAHCQEALQLAVDPPVRVDALLQIADLHSNAGDSASADEALRLADDIAAQADAITQADVELERSLVERRAGHWEISRAAASPRDDSTRPSQSPRWPPPQGSWKALSTSSITQWTLPKPFGRKPSIPSFAPACSSPCGRLSTAVCNC